MEYISLLQWSTSLYYIGVHHSIAMEYIRYVLVQWSASVFKKPRTYSIPIWPGIVEEPSCFNFYKVG